MRKDKITNTNFKNIWKSDEIIITENSNNCYYEIGEKVTMDIAEAVAIMLRMGIKGDVWNTKIDKKDIFNVSPENALYWMSGGDDEWVLQDNYKKSWHECYLTYQREFGLKVIEIIEKSETLGDIKREFIKNLNLQTIYEFSLRKGIA